MSTGSGLTCCVNYKKSERRQAARPELRIVIAVGVVMAVAGISLATPYCARDIDLDHRIFNSIGQCVATDG